MDHVAAAEGEDDAWVERVGPVAGAAERVRQDLNLQAAGAVSEGARAERQQAGVDVPGHRLGQLHRVALAAAENAAAAEQCRTYVNDPHGTPPQATATPDPVAVQRRPVGRHSFRPACGAL